MKKFIMTFENAPEERAENAQALAEQIDAEVYEGGEKLWDNLVAICEQVPEGEGVIIAEDDVKISSKFNPVEGDEIINYFYNVKGSFNALYKIKGQNYCFNQLVYYPAWFVELVKNNDNVIKTKCKSFYDRNLTDNIIAIILREIGRDFLATSKTYAYALDFESTLGHTNSFAQNANYIGD